jgi:hypothetical protein
VGEEEASSEGNETFSKRRALVGDPLDGPASRRLVLDAGDGLDGVKEEVALLGVFNVGIDEEGVCLGVYVLHHDLEAGLGSLDLVGESLDDVLVDDTVEGSEEGEDVGDA